MFTRDEPAMCPVVALLVFVTVCMPSRPNSKGALFHFGDGTVHGRDQLIQEVYAVLQDHGLTIPSVMVIAFRLRQPLQQQLWEY